MTGNTFIPAPPTGAWLVMFNPDDDDEYDDSTYLILGWELSEEDGHWGFPIIVQNARARITDPAECYRWHVVYGHENVDEAARHFLNNAKADFRRNVANRKIALRAWLLGHPRAVIKGEESGRKADVYWAAGELVAEGLAAWGDDGMFLVPAEADGGDV